MSAEFEKTQQLVRKAISEGAYQALPPYLKPEEWFRDLVLTFLYIEGPFSHEDIGAIFGSTKNPSFKHIRRTVNNLREASSPTTQATFPPDSLGFNKPLSLGSRMRSSLRHRGVDSSLASMALLGVEPEQIFKIAADVDIEVKVGDRKLKKYLKVVNDPFQAQELLNVVPRSLYIRNRSGEDSLFVSLTRMAEQANVAVALYDSARLRPLGLVLQEAGFPLHIPNNPGVKYNKSYFTLSQFKEKGICLIQRYKFGNGKSG